MTSGSRVFFSAIDRLHGQEVWLSDGTAAGTRLIEDVTPGQAGSQPRRLTAFLGGIAYLAGVSRRLLWTDGVTTTELTGASGSDAPPIAIGNTLFFAANAAGAGFELWTSDGTPGGTGLLADISPGVTGSEPYSFVEANGVAYFIARINGARRLWRSDGTTIGTFEVSPGVSYGNVGQLVAVGNAVYFSAGTSGTAALWATDGSAAGTRLVRGGFANGPNALTAFGSDVLFAADDGVLGLEPWISDGTNGGTRVLKDIHPSTPPLGAFFFEVVGSRAFFRAEDGVTGSELWSTDGTTAGTDLVLDISPGPMSSLPRSPIALNGLLYFVADDGSRGSELWSSDGTAANTRIVRDISPFGNFSPISFAQLGNRLFFGGNDVATGYEPWISDGTAQGTQRIIDIGIEPGASDPVDFSPFLRDAIFVAGDGVNGQEPYISDGTTGGTRMLADIHPGSGSSSAVGFTVWQGRTWFSAFEPNTGNELWSTDGSTNGTTLFADLFPGASPSRPSQFTPLDESMVFAASAPTLGRELWTSDGTPAGTMVIDLDPATFANPSNLTRAGNVAFFTARDSAHGTEIWKTDGTAAGTGLVADLVPGPTGSAFNNFVAVGDRMFFVGTTTNTFPPSDIELWTSDGTAAGTHRVLDIAPGPASSLPSSLVAWQGKLWFVASSNPSPFGGQGLWCSDGTATGTFQVASSTRIRGPLVPAADRLFFDGGGELWASDGTASGTGLVLEIVPGSFDSNPDEIVAAGSSRRIVFSAFGDGGRELWTSDGTSSGTERIADIWPGTVGSDPVQIHRCGSSIYFNADDGVSGREPFVLTLESLEATLAEAFGEGCPGTFGVPSISATGIPSLGASYSVDLESVIPSTPAAFLLSTDLIPGGGRVGCFPPLAPPFVGVPVAVDSLGRATQPLSVMNDPQIIGDDYFVQFAAIDPAGGLLGVISLSQPLHLVVGRP